MRLVLPLLAVLLALTGCARPTSPTEAPSVTPEPEPAAPPPAAALIVTSPAFPPGAAIPARFTCEGDDVSPDLTWTAGPAGTVAYALVVDDPDAPSGSWTHWVAWNLAGTSLPAAAQGAAGLVEGTNSWGKVGYGGPCPPSGTHRYRFKVVALDAKLDLPTTTDQAGLEAAMQGHVLARGELVGTYQKQGR